MPIKVAVIGAGSIGFTRRLMRDILSVPELADSEFAFHDLNKHNLDMIAQLAARDIEANGRIGSSSFKNAQTLPQPLPKSWSLHTS